MDITSIFRPLLSKLTLPLVIFHLLFLVIVIKNFPTQGTLIGWDALSPELNYSANLSHALFASWQPHYGTGTLTGHGFGATLPHIVLTSGIDLFLPSAWVRPTIILFCLYLGGLGIFFLTLTLLELISVSAQHTNLHRLHPWLALISCLFYCFNFATTQIFYLPLEAFTVHFAFLPWLFLVAKQYLERATNRKLLIVFIINWLASVQGFIPSVFVAYMVALSLFLLTTILVQPSRTTLKHCAVLLLITFLANSYWLFPFGYYTLTHNQTFLDSYNNSLSTPDFVARNQRYGDLLNVTLLKSFFQEGRLFNEAIFQPWLSHWQNFAIPVIGFCLFVFSGVGLIGNLLKKQTRKIWLPFAVVYIFFFTTLATQTPPFSVITQMLYSVSSTYEQAFRTAFTKVGIGLAFSYALFLPFGIRILIETISRYRKTSFGILAVIFAGLIFYFSPHFLGHTFYSRLKVAIPSANLEVIEYFQQQPNQGKIADIPTDCAEGWYSYDWGYTGSGFYWYAFPQPVLARSFDVWNSANEQYYWQMSYALRQGDPNLLVQVLNQYGANWVIYDPNLTHCNSSTGFDYPLNPLALMLSLPEFSLELITSTETTYPIYVFKRSEVRDLSVAVQNKGVPWSYIDQVHLNKGDYYSLNESPISYPFAGLFSAKGELQPEGYHVKTEDSDLLIENELRLKLPLALHMPDITETSNFIYAKIEYVPTTDGVQVLLRYLTSTISQTENQSNFVSDLGTVKAFVDDLRVGLDEYENYSQYVLLRTNRSNIVWIVNNDDTILIDWNSNLDPIFQQVLSSQPTVSLNSATSLEVRVPILPDTFNISTDTVLLPETCSDGEKNSSSDRSKYQIEYHDQTKVTGIIYYDVNSSQCSSFSLSADKIRDGAVLFLTNENVTGLPLRLTVSDNYGRNYLDFFLKDGPGYYFIPALPDQVSDLNIWFKNTSVSSTASENKVSGFAITPFPTSYLNELSLTSPEPTLKKTKVIDQNVAFLYRLNIGEAELLALNQSWDPGWIAFPQWEFLKPYEKVRYNGWANGWLIPANQQTITIVYWPQLLSFMGLGLFGLTTGVLMIKVLSFKSPHHTQKVKQILVGHY